MGLVRDHSPVLLVMAIFSRHTAALDWACRQVVHLYGPIQIKSDPLVFDQTDFYQPSMGRDLRKMLIAFTGRINAEQLVEIKLKANQLEKEYTAQAEHLESRPLNIDPGYLTEAKLVLATTKDRDHRLYLGQGIFAEVTLYFHKGHWKTRPWTYPDYQTASYHNFFNECRAYLRANRPDAGQSQDCGPR